MALNYETVHKDESSVSECLILGAFFQNLRFDCSICPTKSLSFAISWIAHDFKSTMMDCPLLLCMALHICLDQCRDSRLSYIRDM